MPWCKNGVEIWDVFYMMEIWRDIPGYAGIYQVSNLGNIKRLAGHNGRYSQSEHLLKTTIGKNGYLHVTLTKNSKCKCFAVHKIVALVFVFNPYKFHWINHKNEIKNDNRAENLEWCTARYNNHYGMAESKNYKPVIGISVIDGTELHFDSIKDASKTLGINAPNIGSCCHGKRKTAGKYKWEFAL